MIGRHDSSLVMKVLGCMKNNKEKLSNSLIWKFQGHDSPNKKDKGVRYPKHRSSLRRSFKYTIMDNNITTESMHIMVERMVA